MVKIVTNYFSLFRLFVWLKWKENNKLSERIVCLMQMIGSAQRKRVSKRERENKAHFTVSIIRIIIICFDLNENECDPYQYSSSNKREVTEEKKLFSFLSIFWSECESSFSAKFKVDLRKSKIKENQKRNALNYYPTHIHNTQING